MAKAERIVGALESSDLSEADNLDDVADIDVIRALGLVGALDPLATLIWRLKYAQDGSVAKDVCWGLGQRLAQAYPRLTRQPELARRIVMTVVDHYIDPNCRACGGKGHLPVVLSPQVLEDAHCPTCGGSGQRELPKVQEGEADQAAQWLRGLVDRKEADAASAVMRRLARRMEF